ncbi:hypothetical protein POM88_018190 [Heracleum sosnowskyi]|uniref:Uncharacterized protein n=1 Tax=Heracleum sosnowskyi TaxID=360622 RepID=A0AAD8IT85_9APIA|nr:hypothetical protein POM88_018190 [Heracleum sosnowskyi]
MVEDDATRKEWESLPGRTVRELNSSDGTYSGEEHTSKSDESNLHVPSESSTLVEGNEKNSQLSLCENLGNLKMKSAVGRPRKRVRGIKNPFDMGFSRKKMVKNFKNSKRIKGRIKSKGLTSDLPPILEATEQDNLIEAGQILECADKLGLIFQGSREEVVKKIAC